MFWYPSNKNLASVFTTPCFLAIFFMAHVLFGAENSWDFSHPTFRITALLHTLRSRVYCVLMGYPSQKMTQYTLHLRSELVKIGDIY